MESLVEGVNQRCSCGETGEEETGVSGVVWDVLITLVYLMSESVENNTIVFAVELSFMWNVEKLRGSSENV